MHQYPVLFFGAFIKDIILKSGIKYRRVLKKLIMFPSDGRDSMIFLKFYNLYITPTVIGVGVLEMLMNSVSISEFMNDFLAFNVAFKFS